jgi:hypothetical protein
MENGWIPTVGEAVARKVGTDAEDGIVIALDLRWDAGRASGMVTTLSLDGKTARALGLRDFWDLYSRHTTPRRPTVAIEGVSISLGSDASISAGAASMRITREDLRRLDLATRAAVAELDRMEEAEQAARRADHGGMGRRR